LVMYCNRSVNLGRRECYLQSVDCVTVSFKDGSHARLGKRCGMICLQMACSFFYSDSECCQSCPSLQRLLEEAQSLGVSKSGELFSAEFLVALGAPYLCTKSVPLDLTILSKHILKEGGLVAIAYDKDRNNAPCLRKGHAAHWGLVHGAICL
jgi:hypothetical protein